MEGAQLPGCGDQPAGGVPWLLCADLCGAGAPSASFLREEFPTRGVGLLAQVTGQSHGAVRQE